MNYRDPILKLALGFVLTLTPARADTAIQNTPIATAAEMRQLSGWSKTHLRAKHEPPPFSFSYAGQPSAEKLANWRAQSEPHHLDRERTEFIRTWTDDTTGLEVRCVAVEYTDFPVVEWTV